MKKYILLFISISLYATTVFGRLNPGYSRTLPDAASGFPTLDEAANDFSQNANGPSIQRNREIGTTFYYDPETNTYGYVKPVKGSKDEVFPPTNDNLPEGTTPAGVGHTHSAYDNYYGYGDAANYFSDRDLEYADDRNLPIYVGTPNGSFKKYDPSLPKSDDNPKTIHQDLPYDPNDPSSKIYNDDDNSGEKNEDEVH